MLDELAQALDRERAALELLLHRSLAARHVLAEGDTRFLAAAAADVRDATAALAACETRRAALVAVLAAPPAGDVAAEEPSLADLAGTCAEPYRLILDEARVALRALVGELRATLAEDRRLAASGARLIERRLAASAG